jgi:hypothetical protein
MGACTCSFAVTTVLAIGLSGFGGQALAQDQGPDSPAEHRSQRVVLYTDLPVEKAKASLVELEKVLDFATEHWKRPARGLIECHVVSDLPRWPTKLPQHVREAIEAGAGITITQTLRSGGSFQARATVYASAKGTSVKHEIVHAYCRQAFGEVGPLWYAEGMAEMGQYFSPDAPGVNCEAGLARHLRTTPAPPLNDVLAMKQRTGEGYAWTWSLCHVLANHPRYQDRFRQLGLALVAGKKGELRTAFTRHPAIAKEIECIDFERRLMLANLEVGYRADLCAWDWDTEFGPIEPGKTGEVTIEAARGWQATGLEVKPGDRVPYRTAGGWRLTKNGRAISADGDARGQGKLVGVLLRVEGPADESLRDSSRLVETRPRGLQLGEPFELGRQGTWTAREAGRLYVRCRDAWHELADNESSITLTLPRLTVAASAKTAAKGTKSPSSKTAAKPATASKPTPKLSQAEADAASRLRVAKLLMKSKPELAKQRLAELIERYPDSPAAKEAGELLKELE